MTLKEARKEAKDHVGHSKDDGGAVYIDQVETEPGPFEDYQTGKTIKVRCKSHPDGQHHFIQCDDQPPATCVCGATEGGGV